MICKFCGKEVDDNDKLCKYCGSSLQGQSKVRQTEYIRQDSAADETSDMTVAMHKVGDRSGSAPSGFESSRQVQREVEGGSRQEKNQTQNPVSYTHLDVYKRQE